MAADGLRTVLALEVAISRQWAENTGRDPAPDPGDELAQPAWGAPRIDGELLRLGTRLRSRRSPSTWRGVAEGARRPRRHSAQLPGWRRRDGLSGHADSWLSWMAPRSPWQNGHVKKLIGSIRRECLDHIIVLGEGHLRRTAAAYTRYYNGVRTHLSLDKDAPSHRPIQRARPARCSAGPRTGFRTAVRSDDAGTPGRSGAAARSPSARRSASP